MNKLTKRQYLCQDLNLLYKEDITIQKENKDAVCVSYRHSINFLRSYYLHLPGANNININKWILKFEAPFAKGRLDILIKMGQCYCDHGADFYSTEDFQKLIDELLYFGHCHYPFDVYFYDKQNKLDYFHIW